jgi:hypothetical protein
MYPNSLVVQLERIRRCFGDLRRDDFRDIATIILTADRTILELARYKTIGWWAGTPKWRTAMKNLSKD